MNRFTHTLVNPDVCHLPGLKVPQPPRNWTSIRTAQPGATTSRSHPSSWYDLANLLPDGAFMRGRFRGQSQHKTLPGR